MRRTHLLDILDFYEAVYPEEHATTDRIRELVSRHDDCFHRSCYPGHITGSAWIVSEDGQRHLLTRHRKLNRWLQLGGHADGQTEPHEVALREAREESGMTLFTLVSVHGRVMPFDLDVHRIPARGNDPEHEHHDFRYLLVARSGQNITLSDESHDLRWFTAEQIQEITQEESLLRMLRKTGSLLTG